MIGKSHVACAAAGWALLAPPLAEALGLPMGLPLLAISLPIAAGAGVAPDIDHPDATIARTHGIVSRLLSRTVHKISGGHRHATHWLSTGAAAGLAVALAAARWPQWSIAVAMATCGAWTIRLAMPYRWDRTGAPFFALGLAALAYMLAPPTWWLGPAVAYGFTIHILCDWVCKGTGVPLFGLPWSRSSKRRHAAGLLLIASPAEAAVAKLAVTVCVLAVAYQVWATIA